MPFFDPIEMGDKQSVVFEFKAFMANDPVSIEEFFHNWQGKYSPRDGDNIAFADGRIDIGSSFGDGFYVGYVTRYDVSFSASKGLTDLIHSSKNQSNFALNEEQIITGKIDGVSAHGIVFSKFYEFLNNDFNSIKFGLGLSFLYGYEMQQGRLDGTYKRTGANSFDAVANTSYYYTNNYLYDLDVPNVRGYGYSNHLSFAYQNKKHNFSFKVVGNDIFANIYWKDLPYSQVNLNSNNTTLDSDGFLKFNPTISGVEKREDYKQRLLSKWEIESIIKLYEKTQLIGGIDFTKYVNIPYLKLQYDFNHNFYARFIYETRFQSGGIELRYKDFKLGLIADSIKNFSSAGLTSSFNISF